MENTANAAQLLGEKELFVFDMDGTIYLEDRVFPFAVRFIRHLRAHGKRVLFFTNNASRASDFYMERLTRMESRWYRRPRNRRILWFPALTPN